LDALELIGRDRPLFVRDVAASEDLIRDAIRGRRVLVVGGAGSIGSEIVRQVFRRSPAALHVIDISENNLAELVRDLRSTLGYLEGETRFLPLDAGGPEAAAFIAHQRPYDLVLNLAALKHVRSEKDEFSLMRMVKVNVLDSLTILSWAREMAAAKYFAVSTDKATNPANLMGATKRIMEDGIFRWESGTRVSTARFANVAFSDGSLLHSFRQRFERGQPIAAPNDVRRYFVTGEESGLLCLLSLVLGNQGDVFFPKLDSDAHLLTFSAIACRFLEERGYEPLELPTEEAARDHAAELIEGGKWPVYFFKTDTSGEKPFEEFYTEGSEVDWSRFCDIGVSHQRPLEPLHRERVDVFVERINGLRRRGSWTKAELVGLIEAACPELTHVETGSSLDERM
jgi:nucleoside-diphosphate-sugar epimerase